MDEGRISGGEYSQLLQVDKLPVDFIGFYFFDKKSIEYGISSGCASAYALSADAMAPKLSPG